MAVQGIGVDVVDLPRFEATLQRTPELRTRVFTAAELSGDLSTPSLAARFAAKEALVKALRSGAGLSWQDIEIVTDASGAPSFALHGAAQARVQELGLTLHLSLSHDTGVATAFVVAES